MATDSFPLSFGCPSVPFRSTPLSVGARWSVCNAMLWRVNGVGRRPNHGRTI